MTMTGAILRSWRHPRIVLRQLLAQDRNEGRLLVYLTLALGLVFIAQWPRLAREASELINFNAYLAGALFGIMFIGPLLAYAVAGLLTLPLWLARRVEGFAVRLALFWALLASAPAMLLQAALTELLGVGAMSQVLAALVLALFVWILVSGLRVALEAARRPA